MTTHITLRNLRQQLQAERDLLDLRVRERTVELEALKNQLEIENEYLKDEIEVSHPFKEIVGDSEALTEILQRVEMVAPTNSTVLISSVKAAPAKNSSPAPFMHVARVKNGRW